MTTRYEKAFADLAEKNEGAFVPFLMLSDPTPEDALEILRTVIDAGADVLELGVPFSDPIADGPTIQGAHSPDEKVHIPAVARFWQLLSALLAAIPAKA